MAGEGLARARAYGGHNGGSQQDQGGVNRSGSIRAFVSSICLSRFGFFTNQSVDLVYAQLSFFFWFDRPSNIPVEEVFVRLKCSSEGLTSSEADARTAMFGPNKLEEKKV